LDPAAAGRWPRPQLKEVHVTNSLRILAASGLALSMALGIGACASDRSASGGQSSAGQFVDDAAITTKVKAAIVKDVGAKAATDVKVTTEGGVVQLSGFASSQDEASRAVAAAQKVSGVKSVKNDIRLK
jgi:hyperosmotically inducible protein